MELILFKNVELVISRAEGARLAILSTFVERIDVNALPATLREAIQVTRRLGYSYTWIDPLCILQDSKEDWQTERISSFTVAVT